MGQPGYWHHAWSSPNKQDEVAHDLTTCWVGDEVAGYNGHHKDKAHDHCEDLTRPEYHEQQQGCYEAGSNLTGLHYNKHISRID